MQLKKLVVSVNLLHYILIYNVSGIIVIVAGATQKCLLQTLTKHVRTSHGHDVCH